ncbi:hypothetical protein Q0812_06020 [Brevundimonas sp. 2R-24]|uniref:Uncharacterized protein n=1 Tax=Peiella sedimenti TaxID=3061083 RepID=A0ABT8SNX5_9CAUL|nr:hypothetical protein [Caulobacteraceae bacterium XZ-24]
MTRDQIKSIGDDIAYMKAMAEEGSRGPLLGGSILVAAGLIFGPASLVHWAVQADILAIGMANVTWIWMAALVAFVVALAVLSRRVGRMPGAMSPANRASGTAWMAVGLSIFFLALSLAAMSYRIESALPALIFPSLIVGLYGAGWAVSAAMSGQKWLWAPAYGGWLAAPVLAWFTGEPAQYLVYAGVLMLLTIAPGLVLMRQEPSDVV